MINLPNRAQTLIDHLGLQAHPEGGYYRETYRGAISKTNGRSASTMIYFLLTSADRSLLHRIDADEGWHHYEGDCIRIHIIEQGAHRWIDLGHLDDGVSPQALVPADLWFGAEVLPGPHGFALVGCTVAPGFEFSQFELADRKRLLSDAPQCREIIERLT